MDIRDINLPESGLGSAASISQHLGHLATLKEAQRQLGSASSLGQAALEAAKVFERTQGARGIAAGAYFGIQSEELARISSLAREQAASFARLPETARALSAMKECIAASQAGIAAMTEQAEARRAASAWALEALERTRPKLPDIRDIGASVEAMRPTRGMCPPPAYEPPLMPPLTWHQLEEDDNSYVEDLEGQLDAVKAENQALLAENRALREGQELLKRKIRHLKQQLDAPMFRNMVEHTDPDVPPNDSRFATD